MFGTFCRLLLAFVVLGCITTYSFAATHIALVIGNSRYISVPTLKNAKNDAIDVGAKFKQIGYEVDILFNVDAAELRDGLKKFRKKARHADVAVIYYAGHGIEIDKRNYLVPVDAELIEADDVEDEAIPLDYLVRTVARAKKLSVIMLDACRNNPFLDAMETVDSFRSVGKRGLAKVETRKKGLISFAAKEGTVASDGKGRNSPYARAIMKGLDDKNLEAGFFFRRVSDLVEKATDGVQIPHAYHNLSGELVYLHPKGGQTNTAVVTVVAKTGTVPVTTPDPEDVAGRTWKIIRDGKDVRVFRRFIDRFTGTFYEALARDKIKDLTRVAAKKSDSVPGPTPVGPGTIRPGPTPIQDNSRPMLSVYNNVDLFGGDLYREGRRASDVDGCARLCGQDSSCSAFTFVISQRKCYLKNGYENVQEFPGAISGLIIQAKDPGDAPVLRAEWRSFYGKDLPTRRDLRSLGGIRSFAGCLSACSNTSSCRAVSYSAKRDQCWMKDRTNIKPVRNRSARNNRISSAIRVSSNHFPTSVHELD